MSLRWPRHCCLQRELSALPVFQFTITVLVGSSIGHGPDWPRSNTSRPIVVSNGWRSIPAGSLLRSTLGRAAALHNHTLLKLPLKKPLSYECIQVQMMPAIPKALRQGCISPWDPSRPPRYVPIAAKQVFNATTSSSSRAVAVHYLG